jgi:beta-galactosidase
MAFCSATLYAELRFYVREVFRLPSLGRIAILPILFALAVPLAAQDPLLLGTAWYPEQWPESRWETDLTLMQQAHMHVVRVAEFAWSTLEPSEGHFEFGWLDRAIALAGKHDIKVVLGTPSAAPPAWLTTKYPETLRVEEDGRRAEHGNRQQFSFSDARYRELCVRMAHEMALHYGHNANVIGWQIDNEIGAPTFDPSAVAQWHRWLAAKYKNVGDLNRRWATAYWSQTYDSFDEVPFHSRNENPALLLDYKHFVTDTWTSYVQSQVDAIRPVADSRQFITTNTMHWYSVYDHYELHKGLDIAAWDDYVPDGRLDAALNAAQHDLVRGYKSKNFWIMETQPAFVNWGAVNSPLPPGVTREMAWQAIGHGADAVLYWQWRSAPNGQEQYHGTLLGADGLPVPVYAEIQRLGADMDKVNAAMALTQTTVHSQVAMVQSYDSHWAIDFQKHSNKFDYVASFMDFYRAASPIAQSIDIVSPDASLSGYPIVFAPALNVITEATAKHLLEYVRGGGRLVLGTRSGMKNGDDGLQVNRQPGPLAEALGATVEQFYALDAPVKVAGDVGAGTAGVWAEDIKPTAPDTRVLLTYGAGDGWLNGHAAAVSRAYGRGEITYVGCDLDAGLMSALVAKMLEGAGVQPILAKLPAGVELMQRSGAGKAPVWILINHSGSAQRVGGLPAGTDLLTGRQEAPRELGPHEVVVWALTRVQ